MADLDTATLKAFCDTILPSVDRSGELEAYWRAQASDLGVDQVIGMLVGGGALPRAQCEAVCGVVGALAGQRFAALELVEREQILHAMCAASPEAQVGIDLLRYIALLLAFNLGDEKGANPFWAGMGYDGPLATPTGASKPIQPVALGGDRLDLEADAVIVGSGSGGSVAAWALANGGLNVVVMEMGGYYTEADFPQNELWAHQNLYYRNGLTATADLNVAMLAGSALGGGTVINWMNCVRTPDFVRSEWAKAGLAGLDTSDYDRHMDAVLNRIGASPETAHPNGPNARLLEGCERLGYHSSRLVVNADAGKFDFRQAGFTGMGDVTCSKQSGDRTFLLDAYRRDARFVVRCRAERILVESGRAVGVIGTATDESGRSVSVNVRAPRVVVSCGSLESPALLLRSGIGGPAVGDNLHLHPAATILGVYEERQEGNLGWPQTAYSTQFANRKDGYGLLLETPAWMPGLSVAAMPWVNGRTHKEMVTKFPYLSGLLLLVRDRGHGRVTIDAEGNAVHTYPFGDALDQEHFRLGQEELVRIHVAAGAKQIYGFGRDLPCWKVGEDVDAFIERVKSVPIKSGAQPVFSAHQMGSCRIGTGPETSVANGIGQLHDVKGVWIADTSGFPSASGANPMITAMAMAHRTAEAILTD